MKKYKSVKSMVTDLGNKEFIKEYKKIIKSSSISRNLFRCRAIRFISINRMAKAIDKTPEEIEEIESKLDCEIKISDIISYTKYLDFSLTIDFTSGRIKVIRKDTKKINGE